MGNGTHTQRGTHAGVENTVTTVTPDTQIVKRNIVTKFADFGLKRVVFCGTN